MDDFLNLIKRDPQVEIKIKDILDECNRLPSNYQSKIRYDFLTQNVILKEIKNLMGTKIVDIDIELKTKSGRIKYLESKLI